ncbi:hypothetical protein [Roseinatronobacter alkalisoli]|uniref:Alpha/beta hydrolase n=1 Tax=Roseinatronobacter alkalisoli TaxID=3028235 RepID=A0ABT5TEB5_9RHOB|nr:hypothetical protein [Roseinatronobacter sp. HJB301]MDD7973450.1 hypothetical protein [Roseinatronobacter sp. HJB301]
MLLFFMSQHRAASEPQPPDFNPSTEPALLVSSFDELRPAANNPLIVTGYPGDGLQPLRYSET